MQEEVKKLSEGKSFDEICKIIYRLENSSTKPTKDTSQLMTTVSNGTSNSINTLGYSGRGRGRGGGRGGSVRRGGGNSSTPHAAWRSKLTNRPDLVNFRDIHWTSEPSAQRRGTWPTTAEFPQTDKSGTNS